MTEFGGPPQPDQNQAPEEFHEASPQSAFMVVKAARLFAKTLLEQPRKHESDWIMAYPRDYTPGEMVDPESKSPFARYFQLQYSDRDTFLGKLEEWDSRLFSFKHQAEERGVKFPQFFVTLPLEAVDNPAVEVHYDAAAYEIGAPAGVKAVVPFEGPPKIKELTWVDKGQGVQGPVGEWRPMSDEEAGSLLMDLGEINQRLQDHVAGGS